MTQGLSYRDAGVDIDAGDALVEAIKPFAKRTLRPEVLTGIGGFGALCEIPRKYRQPVLVSGTDGVGTKLKLAFLLGRHDTVGVDLVAMSANDVVVQGAEPLFFLDYFACGQLETAGRGGRRQGRRARLRARRLRADRRRDRRDAGDVSGRASTTWPASASGWSKSDAIIDGRTIVPGDVLLGLASSGAHSNGYSLVRKILERTRPDLGADFPRPVAGRGAARADAHLREAVLGLLAALPVKGLAHITGGGITGNVPRMLPQGTRAVIQAAAWPRPALFDWLQREGDVAEAEMHRVFNCGIGMVMALSPPTTRSARPRYLRRPARRCSRSAASSAARAPQRTRSCSEPRAGRRIGYAARQTSGQRAQADFLRA